MGRGPLLTTLLGAETLPASIGGYHRAVTKAPGWVQGAEFAFTARTERLHGSPRSLPVTAPSPAAVSSGCLWEETPKQGMNRAGPSSVPSRGLPG